MSYQVVHNEELNQKWNLSTACYPSVVFKLVIFNP